MKDKCHQWNLEKIDIDPWKETKWNDGKQCPERQRGGRKELKKLTWKVQSLSFKGDAPEKEKKEMVWVNRLLIFAKRKTAYL